MLDRSWFSKPLRPLLTRDLSGFSSLIKIKYKSGSDQKFGGSNPSTANLPRLNLKQGLLQNLRILQLPHQLEYAKTRTSLYGIEYVPYKSFFSKKALHIRQEERKRIDSMKDTRESDDGRHSSSGGDTQHTLLNVNRVRRAANIQKPSELQAPEPHPDQPSAST